MEPGPCASSPSEPCQARKGAALRRITTSAAGRLGSMMGSAGLQAAIDPSSCPGIDSTAGGRSAAVAAALSASAGVELDDQPGGPVGSLGP